MPSRKRAKGKARKAKARASNCSLILHNESVCRHGCEVISKDDICYKLVEQLEVEMNEVINSMSGEQPLFDFYNATNKRMRANKKYDIIWNDDSDETRLKLQSLLANLGTNLILRLLSPSKSKRWISAFVLGVATISFNYMKDDMRKAFTSSTAKAYLLDFQDGHCYDIIKFFHKRIPCQCLKKVYLKERSKPRLSICNNCTAKKDRSQLYQCNGCRYIHYCGLKCQRSDWPEHQPRCLLHRQYSSGQF